MRRVGHARFMSGNGAKGVFMFFGFGLECVLVSNSRTTRPVSIGAVLRGVLLWTCWLTCGLAQAQQSWSLEDALSRALQDNPVVLGSRAASAAAMAEREGAEWQRYPSVSVEANGAGSGGSSAVLRVDQPLWTWGRIDAGIDAAAYRAGAAAWAVFEARRDIALKVVAVWVEAARQQARREVAGLSVANHERLVELITRRVEFEVSPRIDQEFAQSRLLQARNELAAVDQGLNSALHQLHQLVGTRVAQVQGKFDDPGMPLDLSMALSLAQSTSPVLRRLDEEMRAAGEDIKSRRAVIYPQVSARFERYVGQRPGGLNDDQRVMVVVTAQPGAGFSAGSAVQAAVSRREALVYGRETAVRAIVQQVSADWEEWGAARQRAQNSGEARTMSIAVFDSYTRQFTAGRKTWIDVLNSIRETTQTALAVIDAEAQAYAAAQRLRVLTGRIDFGVHHAR